jgi:hypothetical protein
MNKGEFLTRVSIWLAFGAYIAAAVTFALSRNRRGLLAVARVAYTIACASLLIHILWAFHFYHQWSQLSALRETARQTNEVTGLNWSGGLYVNYAVLIGWTVDVCWWWFRGLESYWTRPKWLTITWHAFLVFIIFNATIVFGHGAARWAGLMVCVCWGLAAWAIARGPQRGTATL